MNEPTVPETVISALETVRADGRTNMLDRRAVVYYADRINEERGELVCDPGAIIYLHEATPKQYMAALNEMGDRRAGAQPA